jgi:hypothetical protein
MVRAAMSDEAERCRSGLAACSRSVRRRSEADMVASPRLRRAPRPKEDEHPLKGVKARLSVHTIDSRGLKGALP